MTQLLLIVALTLLVEAAAGYPQAIYQRVGHPVTWLGALISKLERRWNSPQLPAVRRKANGILALAVLVIVSGGLAAALHIGLTAWHTPGLAILALLASTLLAQRSLNAHVASVARALEREGLDAARAAVSRIVGRNPAALDEAGVARAAIESLAENYADGVVAPALWLAVAGLPGCAVYKAVNTADSMIGHKSERYLHYGWASARLDDLLNLPASRAAAVVLTLAAVVTPGAAPAAAIRCVRRDASRHRSPNAGYPEAAMAGALGLKLNGPRVYGDTRVDDAYMGDGRTEATAADIRRALSLYRRACLIQWLFVAGAATALISL